MTIQRADWVKTDCSSMVGLVRRIARDGSWADVRWHSRGAEWSKRMRTSDLTVVTRIETPDFVVTDLTREKELAAEEKP